MIDIDEKIKEILENAYIENYSFADARESRREDAEKIKQLIRNVLAEIKPERTLNPGDRTLDKWTLGFEECIDEIEAKIKELGLS